MLKLTLKTLVAPLALGSSLISAPAMATDFMTIREYYSDATYTVSVGLSGNDCARNQFSIGQVTEFVIVSREPCAGTWPPPGWNP